MEVEVTMLCCPRKANDSLIFDVNDTALDNLPPALCVIISAVWGTSLQINSTCGEWKFATSICFNTASLLCVCVVIITEKILLKANTNLMSYG